MKIMFPCSFQIDVKKTSSESLVSTVNVSFCTYEFCVFMFFYGKALLTKFWGK